MTLQLIMLDRDGVLNLDSEHYIKSPAEFLPIPGSLEAVVRLQHGGFQLAVCTNQSGLGRGLFDLPALEAIHSKLNLSLQALGGSALPIFYCPHQPDAGCDCRKPRPGLLQQALAAAQVAPAAACMIGDSARDLEAAWAIGAQALLVETGNGLATADKLSQRPDAPALLYRCADLAAAADWLLTQRAAS